jgi:hypothetical protein
MFSATSEGNVDGFGRRWGYFQLRPFFTPIRTPISLWQGQGSPASGAMCPLGSYDENGKAGERDEGRIKLRFQMLGAPECDSRMQTHTRRFLY